LPKTTATTKAGSITREGLLSSPWPGFTVPRYTQVPDEIFDVLMPILTEAEFKCLCYICRRTFGFRKNSDAISLNQMSEGITTRDGKVIDRGTGMGRASVKRALSYLTKSGVVEVKKRISEDGEYETNIYSLRILIHDDGSPHIPHPGNNPGLDPGSSSAQRGVGSNITHPQDIKSMEVGSNKAYPRLKSIPKVGSNYHIQEIEHIHTVNNSTSLQQANVVAPLGHTSKTALQESLVDLGITKAAAKRLLAQHTTDKVARVIEYALYRLSKGWQPRESLPGWIVSAITENWQIPSWFKTSTESESQKAAQTQAQQRALQRLEKEREQEEAEMAKQRAKTLRSLGIKKGTDLLWAKVNQWLQERTLWRPALTTAILAGVDEERALILCGYSFSLEMVRQSANVIKDALAALTGSAVNIEVRLEERLFTQEQ
jgi:hypothetical protein